MAIKLVSINIEGQKHLEAVKAFLAREKADVACLMEVYGSDLAWIAQDYPHVVYGPNNVVSAGVTLGVAILSKAPITEQEIFYCDGKSATTLDILGDGTHSPVVVMARIGEYQIGVTHFTWVPNGEADARQREHVSTLLEHLGQQGEFVIVGDFNIPRGRELYHELAKHYHDNIPADIATTIDPDLHRANWKERGKLALVVDYVWTTKAYNVNNVRVVSSVSDHCGLVCSVSKV